MDKFLYTGMNGASTLLRQQMMHTHNLANASTAGYREDFQTVISQQVAGAGLGTRFNGVSNGNSVNADGGPLNPTGNPLDVAIRGDGWFVVQTPDGKEAYTRRGDFHISPDGQLFNGEGLAVLGEGGPVAIPPNQSLSIGNDGTVSVVPLGQSPDTTVVVDRLQLVRIDKQNLTKGLDGLIRTRDGLPAEPAADVQVMSGHLEGSNVNAVEAMVNLINIARTYEMQVKMMASAKETAQKATSLMRME